MAILINASGTKAADGTEQSLVTSTTSGTFVLVVDTNNMANGDSLELRIYTKPLASSSARLAYFASFIHAQALPAKYSVPVPSNNQIQGTLKQTGGVNRNYDWVLLQVDG
jgi:hypothetical protein